MFHLSSFHICDGIAITYMKYSLQYNLLYEYANAHTYIIINITTIISSFVAICFTSAVFTLLVEGYL